MTKTIPTDATPSVPTTIRAAFDEQGYYHAPAVFTGPRLEGLQASFDRIVARLLDSGEDVTANWASAVERLGTADRQIVHTHQVQCYEACWLQALLDPTFLDVACALLGPDVVLHHTKLFYKPPHTGGAFPLHQDWAYFPTRRDSMLAGVIHLADADEDNGCLRVVPGSHRLGRRQGLSGNSAHAPEDLAFLEAHPLETARPIRCQAGDVVFFHYCTLHGSTTNDGDRPRKTVLAQLLAGDDEVENEHGHTNARLPLCGTNWTMRRSLGSRIQG